MLLRPAASSADTSAARDRRRLLSLIVLCAMQLMVILDGTIVTVALPTIADDLAFSPTTLVWVVNAYLVPFAGLLLLGGRLGDLLGRRRVFLGGLAVFTAASLACGLATSAAALLAARVAQGIGGALASSVVLAMIVSLYRSPEQQGRALGAYTFVGAAGATLGLLLGGLLTATAGWPSAFLVQVPIGLVALVVASRAIDVDAGNGLSRGADIAGAVLVTAGVSIGVVTTVQIAEPARSLTATLCGFALAAVLLALFVWRQTRSRDPLLPLRLFRNRALAAGNGVMILIVSAGLGFQFVTALFFQQVMGMSALAIGLAFLPVPAIIAVLSMVVAPRLVARSGARAVLLAGLALLVAGMALLARAPVDARYLIDILPPFTVLGVGMGLTLPAVTMIAMSGAAPEDAGLASGLINTAQQLGGAIGATVLATLAAGRTTALLEVGTPAASAARDGFSAAYGAAATFAAAALVLAAVALPRRTARPLDDAQVPAPDTTPEHRAVEALRR